MNSNELGALLALIPEEERISNLFSKLGFSNLVYGTTSGMYGQDWGHVTKEEFELITVRCCSYNIQDYVQSIRVTTNGPDANAALAIDQEVTVFFTSFGEITNPYFVSPDGKTYTFESVVFEGGLFLIKMIIEELNSPVSEKVFSVREFRESVLLS